MKKLKYSKCVAIFLIAILVTGCVSHRDPSHSEKITIDAYVSVDEILEMISLVNGEKVLTITQEKNAQDEAEIMTGEVRGPLDGGGKTYRLKLVNGKWEIKSIGSWVS